MINDVSKLGFSAGSIKDSYKPVSQKTDTSKSVFEELGSTKPTPLQSKVEKNDDFKSHIEAQTTKPAPVKEKTEQPIRPLETKRMAERPVEKITEKITEKKLNEEEINQQAPVQGFQKIAAPPQQPTNEQPKDLADPNGPVVFEANEIKSQENRTQVADDKLPVIKFMKFMKENYNIEPEEIVDAMNHLSQDELLATPQDSMYAFFGKLGLSSANIAPAKEQYLGMLKELDKADAAKGLGQNVKVEVLDPKKQRQLEINRKLDQMNASFFVTNQAKQQGELRAPQSVITDAAGNKISPEMVNSEKIASEKMSPDKFFTDSRIAGHKQKVDQNSLQEVAPAPNVYKPQNVTMKSLAEVEEPTIESVSAASTDSAAGLMSEIPQQQQDTENANKLAELTSKLNMQLAGLEKSFGAMDKDKSKEDMNQNLDGSANYVSNSHDKQVDPNVGASSFSNELKAADRQNNNQTENIRNIINQAQVMIKRGGGEMKMQLQPEGLGNVNLRVRVEEGGKVGIQMVADTADAKRLLESSLNDLKAHLAEHKLSVDTFKVDVSSDKFNDSLGKQSDQAREDARGFLGQFREQNEQFRNPFQNDNPGLRIYRDHGGKQPANRPQEVANAMAPRKNDNGRLHLVA